MSLEIEYVTEGFVGAGTGRTVIDFDASPTQEFGLASEISKHAVEQGAAVADNVRTQNPTVTVEAIVSNYPITERRFGMDGVSLGSRILELPNGQRATTFGPSSRLNRVHLIDDELVRLQNAGTLLTVRTSLREITNAVLQQSTVHRDPETSSALMVTLVFEVIRIATTERVEIAHAAVRRNQHAGNRGNQPTTPPTPVQRQTMLRRLASMGGLF